MKYKLRRIKALLSYLDKNNFGWARCNLCDLPVNVVKPRMVQYDGSSSCWALCTDCWNESDIETRRLAHYHLWCDWVSSGKPTKSQFSEWDSIKKSVENE